MMNEQVAAKPAGALIADPAWSYRDHLPGKKRGASAHYRTMTTPEIQRMPLPELAADCWLFLWRLHTHHLDALEVAAGWGFGRAPCSEIVWVKQNRAGTRVRMGMGHSLRMAAWFSKGGARRKLTRGSPPFFMRLDSSIRVSPTLSTNW